MVTHIIEVLAGFHNVRCSFIFIQLHPPLPKKFSESSKQNTKSIKFFKAIYVPESEKAMVSHSSTLAWKIPWMEEPSRLQSMGSLGVGHD